MQRLLSRMTAALEPERRLSLRDDVAQPPRAALPRRSLFQLIGDRFGAIPMIFAFIFVSIGAVALAFELIFALTKLI